MRIDEIRQSDISYLEVATSNAITKVIAELDAKQSKEFDKLAKEYKRVDVELKETQLERDRLNGDVKEKLLGLFDLEDKVYTRVIDTTKLVATLSRDSEPAEHFDIEGFISELTPLVAELGVSIQAIRSKYTTTNKAGRAPALKVDLKQPIKTNRKSRKVKESLSTSIEKAIEIMVSKFIHYFNRKMNRFDDKLYNLAEKIKMSFF
jgi:hypothetical protein